MFPEELPRRVMKLFSYQGDIVLDPFNGAGTTTLVAWRLKRRFIGIDVSSQYCREAYRRIQAEMVDNSDLFPEPAPALVLPDTVE
jgi:site-specific DNA-methyltransferase (adenine-specific)